jgi:hypothetical protein
MNYFVFAVSKKSLVFVILIIMYFASLYATYCAGYRRGYDAFYHYMVDKGVF